MSLNPSIPNSSSRPLKVIRLNHKVFHLQSTSPTRNNYPNRLLETRGTNNCHCRKSDKAEYG
jgi:hypothetical protein